MLLLAYSTDTFTDFDFGTQYKPISFSQVYKRVAVCPISPGAATSLTCTSPTPSLFL
jgi:hypothetical protein